jgi:hypothetical protein
MAPYPPANSYDWLAMWYHQQGLLIDEPVPQLGKRLLLNSTKAAFYQTIGRAKDPECKERSVVYLWGIPGKNIEMEETLDTITLMSFDDGDAPLPQVAMTTREEPTGGLAVKMGSAWKDYKISLKPEIVQLFAKVLNQGTIDTFTIRNSMKGFTQEEIKKMILETDEIIFDIFNIDRTIVKEGEYWLLRRKNLEIPN